jgi:Tc toxin complex TcA C-terminal TcB-binding domain
MCYRHESTWNLDLPNPTDYPAFDYAAISDVILHIRFTTRQGIDATTVSKALKDAFPPDETNLALLFSLPHDFPTEWSAFANRAGVDPFAATIRRDYFPYFTQAKP